jgi:predicted permease
VSGALSGFAAIGVLIAIGYLLGRRGTLGPDARAVLARLSLTVATPCLLFTTVTSADPSMLTAPTSVVPLLTCLLAMVLAVVAGAVRRWRGEVRVMTTIAAGFPNLGNLGIPVASYVLGDAALVAPLILFQLAVQSPIAMTTLELRGAGETRGAVRRALANPVLIATVLALAVVFTGLRVPWVVAEPVRILAQMAVPAVLLSFGLSLVGSPLPGRGGDRAALGFVVVSSALVRPVAAWVLAGPVLGAPAATVYAAVVLSALPVAQNVAVWAGHYGAAPRLARESVLLTTVIAPVVIVLATALLR